MPKTFKHSGDMGDIIFSLPTIRALGGGILCLDPNGGHGDPMFIWADKTRTRLTAKSIEAMAPLLLRQPYIKEVRFWKGEPVDYDLDQFRRHVQLNNLSDSHLAAFGLPTTERNAPWLAVDDPITIEGKTIVISRTVRCHGNHAFWELALTQIKDVCVFVGYPKEHEIFVYTFGHDVPYFPTPDVMTLARVIAGAQQFIGNQSLSHALAEAMKKSLINEVYPLHPAAVFERDGAKYV
jgi:hypothetical protein